MISINVWMRQKMKAPLTKTYEEMPQSNVEDN